MTFTEQDEIRPSKCEGLHNHLRSPQTHLVILLHHIPLRISFPDWLTSGIPSLSEERLLSYLATATARPVKAKIEFPFTTGLSLDRKRQRTIKRHDRHASSKICVSIKLCYKCKHLLLATLLDCLLCITYHTQINTQAKAFLAATKRSSAIWQSTCTHRNASIDLILYHL